MFNVVTGLKPLAAKPTRAATGFPVTALVQFCMTPKRRELLRYLRNAIGIKLGGVDNRAGNAADELRRAFHLALL